ncbi:hypothetical protein EYS14_06230 [Alteromonadaceae bacterium M269]|nr:hypothetical protein EYS14_06230 [Alteromonadaceae bacterium M269]
MDIILVTIFILIMLVATAYFAVPSFRSKRKFDNHVAVLLLAELQRIEKIEDHEMMKVDLAEWRIRRDKYLENNELFAEDHARATHH